ncbi:MAG TPA: UDP-N-acetylmuramoyl-tripeptide--D-alanyl-D-alanine ligase [Patescibacteria group bacterium]|nr:UDP-N-acetylmuramoyl-tripeptide--D-alanyl-D-alanine ligase [Patescibacteria group bacterium]
MLLSLSYILFSLLALYAVLFWTYLWQLKEYRFDRLFVHVRDTHQGQKTLLSPLILLPALGIIIFVSGAFYETLSRNFSIISLCILVILFAFSIKEILSKKMRKPVFTVKAMGIFIMTTAIVVCLLFFPLIDIVVWQLILLFLIPIFVGFSVFLFAFPTEVYTDIYTQKAKMKRKTMKKLQVIAVSGSYGKSSTKEIIAHILSQKFHVVKTSLSNNTPLVIAKTLLTNVTENTDFFVVELGAYKRGEIKQLAEMVGPTISVTTAVSDQHLALYGSMKDVIASELELIHVLPRQAPILLNANSKGVEEMAQAIKNQNIVWYGTQGKYIKYIHKALAQNIVPTIRGVEWTYRQGSRSIVFTSPLLGTHTVENILPGVILGLRFGFSMQEIQKAVQTLRPMPKTMEKISLWPNIYVIDDTFNASPESVFSSIAYLTLFKKRKLYVLSPLIELGSMSHERHRQIGEKLADIDIVFLTNKNFLNDITQGIMNKRGKTKIVSGSYQKLAQEIKQTIQKGDAILFEGKEAGIVLKLL